jgi:hypothetical protein
VKSIGARHAGDERAKQGDFDNALERYRLAGADDRVREIEALVAAREKIWQRYKEAKDALANRRQDEAARAFADVVYLQPDFEDAATQLAALVTSKPPGGRQADTPFEGVWGTTIFRPVLKSWLRCIVPTLIAFGVAYSFDLWTPSYDFHHAEWFAACVTIASVAVLAAIEGLGAAVLSLFSARFRANRSSHLNRLKRTILLIVVSYPLLAFLFYQLGWYFEPDFKSYAFRSNFNYEVAFIADLLPVFLVLAVARRKIASVNAAQR